MRTPELICFKLLMQPTRLASPLALPNGPQRNNSRRCHHEPKRQPSKAFTRRHLRGLGLRLSLTDAPEGYRTFRDKHDKCIKVVLKPETVSGSELTKN